MFTRIALLVVVLIAAVLMFAATKPDSFRIERHIRIQASPEKIFALIDNLRSQNTWSPWEKIDPGMKRAYSGPAAGVGAVYEWDGNKDIGQGRMQIVESVAPTRIKLKLDFIKPFEGHNLVEYTLQAQGDVTTVTQAMYGPSPYLSKVIGLFFNMDRMIGGKFETGLANLKVIAEK
jgi:hypothetical protein